MAHMEGKRLLLWMALFVGAGGAVAAGTAGAGEAHPALAAPFALSPATDAHAGGALEVGTPLVALVDDGASMITITAPGLAAVPWVADLGAALYPSPPHPLPSSEADAQPGSGAWTAAKDIPPVAQGSVAPRSSFARRFAPSWVMCVFGLALLGAGWRLRRYGPAVPAVA